MTDEYTPEDANVITLTDEEGKECSFEIIAEKEGSLIMLFSRLRTMRTANTFFSSLKRTRMAKTFL